ncbi:MAG: type II secretion system protein GspF [Deltaproteobacteria bacterium CG11_big_fil_rev_8_21_14_0_20_47_16]|nr:MAG: type II secretion system protein GspF [Deltaproteobacteria bacterium CG11_big_fil_rev_8_21_14_0_20_47_16]
MPVYKYSGVNAKGKKVAGSIDAENEKAARAKLRRTGVFPTSLGGDGKAGGFSLNTEIDIGKYFQKVTVEDLALMTRQLGSLLQAGIPLVEALAALTDQVENPKLRDAVATIREKVTEGTKLSDAMKGYPKIFDTLYVNMIAAGEASGALELVLQRLGDFTEGQSRLTAKVKSAMTYPILMTVVGGGLMILLLTFVVPKITKRLIGMGKELPLPTQILMGISDTLINYWYIFLILGVAIYFGLKRYLNTPNGKEFFDRNILKAPVIGRLIRLLAISRFSRTLGTLLASGVPMLNALDIVRNIVTNTVMRQAIENTRDAVKEGANISDTLKRTGEFPPLVTHMLSVGEKTGELEKMLERVADNYDKQIDNTVTALTSLLEPLMIVVMAGMVAFIVLSVMLPMLQLSDIKHR